MAAQSSPHPGIVVGAVAASATTGALIAIGRRLGNAGTPFAAITAAMLDRTASGSQPALVAGGVLLHLAATFAWSFAFVWALRTMRWRTDASAIAVAAAAFVVSWLIAWSTGNGLASVLPLGDRVVLAVVFAGSLVVGIRFAFALSHNA